MRKFKHLSIERKSLRYKLIVAFALMSVIPLLVIAYFATNYIFPVSEEVMEVSIVVVLTLWVAWLGYVLIREVITPVIDLALETRLIAEGSLESGVSMERGDELGDIAHAVNKMTGRIRGYIGELQNYSKKTAALNVEIHKKVITLTNLMQLGDLISSGAAFDEVVKFATEKIADELDLSFCGIFMKRDEGGFELKSYENRSGKDISFNNAGHLFERYFKQLSRDDYIYTDSRPPVKRWQNEMRETMAGANVILFSLKMNSKIVGGICMGNFASDLRFTEDFLGIIRAFEKELVLGYHSTKAFERVKSMEVVDSLTGLYTRSYLEERMQDEINRAVFYQRPCSLLLVKIDEFEKYSSHYGLQRAKKTLKRLAQFLNGVMTPVGKAGRFEYDEFALLLPEKNKRESMEIAGDICERIAKMELSSDPYDRITVSIGVGENPIDGTTAEEVVDKAYTNMAKAREEGMNGVSGG